MASHSNIPYVINLCNSIIGVAVLALPFCFKECGIILGLILVISSGWLTQKTCHMLLKTAFITKRRTYEFLALQVFGRYGKLLVEICIIGLLIGNCIAFYIIIGDLGPAIIAKLTNLENSTLLRSVIMSLLAIFIALPLGLLNSLERLSRYSAISLLFYGVFVVQVLIAAIPNLWSGVWYSKVVFWNPEGMLKCVPIFALAFSCHGQLFIIYDSLPEASITRMRSIVQQGVSLCAALYILVGCFGYITFCDEEISGDILMNFHQTLFSDIVKLGFVISTVISFPLLIYPCRASIYSLLFSKPEKSLHDSFGSLHIPTLHFKLITIAIVGITLIIGILVPSVEYVLALTGATMGSLICYILPASMIITVATVHKGEGRLMAQIILFLGVSILLVSTFATMTNQGGGENMPVAQESIIKRGHPIVHKDDDVAVAADLEKIIDAAPLSNNDKNILENIKLDAIGNMNIDIKKNLSIASEGQVIKLPSDVKGKDSKEARKEPPNPREPIDLPLISNKSQPPADLPNSGVKLGELKQVKDDIDKREIKEEQLINKKDEELAGQQSQNARSGGVKPEVKSNESVVEQGVQKPKSVAKEDGTNKHLNINNANIESVAELSVDLLGKENIINNQLANAIKQEAVKSQESNILKKEKDTGLDGAQKISFSHAGKSLDMGVDNVIRETEKHIKAVDPLIQVTSKAAEVNSQKKPTNETQAAEGNAGKESKEGIDSDARNLLDELKKQQEVQKQLIDEQRKIIDDLKQHQELMHQNVAASPSPEKINEESNQVNQKEVPQAAAKKSGRLKSKEKNVNQSKQKHDIKVENLKNSVMPVVGSNLPGR